MAKFNATVQLEDVDASNWRQVAAVEPKPGQERFVAPTTYYLCLAHYGADWNPLAITEHGQIVGHVMWAIDEEDSSVWLGGLVVDSGAQGRGIGRSATVAFLDRFASDGVINAALSYSPDNDSARRIYRSVGFEETGESEDDEVVARIRGAWPR